MSEHKFKQGKFDLINTCILCGARVTLMALINGDLRPDEAPQCPVKSRAGKAKVFVGDKEVGEFEISWDGTVWPIWSGGASEEDISCECGAVACGYTLDSPVGHSGWCPIAKGSP